MRRRMSAFGTKRTFVCAAVMSAFGGKADIGETCVNVRLGIANDNSRSKNVIFF